MADKAITDLNTIPGSVDDNNTWFAVAQSGTAYKVSGHEFTLALGTILDGHGGIKTIVYTPPVAPSLTGTMVITLADNSTTTVSIQNGKGISSIAKTGTSGLVDTYTITYNDATTQTFSVTNGAKGDTGDSWYVWIKYAGSQPTQDSDIGDTPDDWIGIYSGTSSTAPAHYTDYEWYEYKGEKGDTGDAATITTQNVSYQESTSGTVAPSGSWTTTVPSVTPGNFLWTRTQLAFNDGTTVTSYSVSRYGIDGTGAVSTVNQISPDSGGNVALTATDIPMSDNQSVQTHVADAETDIGVLQTSLSNVQTVAKKALTGKRAYIIGDSLNLRNGGGFGPYVLSISGMVGQSIGNGSSGFVHQGEGNKTFADLLNTLIGSLTTAEKNSTDYLIVMGGINDIDNATASAEKTAVTSFIATAKAAFPNAELIICPLHTFNWMTPAQYNIYAQITDACHENGVSTTEDFLWWTIVDDYGIDSGDHVHPNAAGNAVLGGLVVNYLLGNSPLRTWSYDLEASICTPVDYVFTRRGRNCFLRVTSNDFTTTPSGDWIIAQTTAASSKRGMANSDLTFGICCLIKSGAYYHMTVGVQNLRDAGLTGAKVKMKPYMTEAFSLQGSTVFATIGWDIGIAKMNPFT